MATKLRDIILIDDDKATNFLHTMVIKKAIEVDTIHVFQKATEALAFLHEWPESHDYCPDIILLDINMPVMNGWEFLEEYHKMNDACKAKVVVVMLTTSLHPNDNLKAEKDPNLKSFMNKPLTKEMVLALVDENF